MRILRILRILRNMKKYWEMKSKKEKTVVLPIASSTRKTIRTAKVNSTRFCNLNVLSCHVKCKSYLKSVLFSARRCFIIHILIEYQCRFKYLARVKRISYSNSQNRYIAIQKLQGFRDKQISTWYFGYMRKQQFSQTIISCVEHQGNLELP